MSDNFCGYANISLEWVIRESQKTFYVADEICYKRCLFTFSFSNSTFHAKNLFYIFNYSEITELGSNKSWILSHHFGRFLQFCLMFNVFHICFLDNLIFVNARISLVMKSGIIRKMMSNLQTINAPLESQGNSRFHG